MFANSKVLPCFAGLAAAAAAAAPVCRSVSAPVECLLPLVVLHSAARRLLLLPTFVLTAAVAVGFPGVFISQVLRGLCHRKHRAKREVARSFSLAKLPELQLVFLAFTASTTALQGGSIKTYKDTLLANHVVFSKRQRPSKNRETTDSCL